jgi:hypothetical protein
MRPVYRRQGGSLAVAGSGRLLDSITRPHVAVTTCDVLFDRQVIAEGLAIADWQVTYDRNAASLARCDVTFAEPARLEGADTDILSPFGYELQLWHGIRFTTPGTSNLVLYDDEEAIYGVDDVVLGSTEVSVVDDVVPLGVFAIQSDDIDGAALAARVSAVDRSQLVVDAIFEADYEIAAGTNYAVAIQALINAGVPGLVYSMAPTSLVTPLIVFSAGDNRWQAAQRMTSSIGQELLFGGLGEVVTRVAANVLDADPVAELHEGVGGVLTGISRRRDRSSAYNRVTVASSNSSNGEVFSAVATDDDPSSPTYYFGPFGRKPRPTITSPYVASQAQADAMALSELRANLGVARSLSMTVAPHPLLEVGDVVSIRRDALGIDEVQVLDVIRMSRSGMTCESRARQDVAA